MSGEYPRALRDLHDLLQAQAQQLTRLEHALQAQAQQLTQIRAAVKPRAQTQPRTPDFDHAQVAGEVLALMSRLSGHTYAARRPDGSPTRAADLVILLLRKGYSETEIRQVVGAQHRRLLASDKYQYFRPSTIFRPSNFEQYLAELPPI